MGLHGIETKTKMLNAKFQMLNSKKRFSCQLSAIRSQMIRFRISDIRQTDDRKLRTENRLSSGFTLIELVLYIAICSIFLTASVSFAWDLIYGRVKSYAQEEVNQNMRFASKRIIYEMRNAQSINTVSASSISLQMADSARNPTIIDVSSNRVRIGYGSSGPCPTTSPCFLTASNVSVTGLSFTDLSSAPNSRNIKFTLTISTGAGAKKEFQETQTYTGSAELRSI